MPCDGTVVPKKEQGRKLCMDWDFSCNEFTDFDFDQKTNVKKDMMNDL